MTIRLLFAGAGVVVATAVLAAAGRWLAGLVSIDDKATLQVQLIAEAV